MYVKMTSLAKIKLLNNFCVVYKRHMLENAKRSQYISSKFINKANIINTSVNSYVSLTTGPKNRYLLLLSKDSEAKKHFSTVNFDSIAFEKVCEETLESLCEYFEELIENNPNFQSADVTYGSGVLTVNFGSQHGTYVINRQSPNQQIWLSSPLSGPKRYDFIPEGKYWVYKHDNVTLHQFLQDEIKNIIKEDIDFSRCSYSSLKK